MSLFISSVSKVRLFDTYRCLSAIQTRKSHWFPYYKPASYPKTKEEREAAAKKYSLLPEEYEPYPEDHLFPIGDYPKLPFESVDAKDPWYNWDNQDLRRNYNEPVHCNQVILLPEYLSTNRTFTGEIKGICLFLTFVGVVGSVIYFLSLFTLIHPVTEMQYPAPGVTHYTFELDYGELEKRKKKKIVCREE